MRARVRLVSRLVASSRQAWRQERRYARRSARRILRSGRKTQPVSRVNAAESGEAGATKDVSEDGFGLIVGSVGDSDSVELAFGDETLKEGVARATGRLFEIGALAFRLGGDVLAGHEK